MFWSLIIVESCCGSVWTEWDMKSCGQREEGAKGQETQDSRMHLLKEKKKNNNEVFFFFFKKKGRRSSVFISEWDRRGL